MIVATAVETAAATAAPTAVATATVSMNYLTNFKFPRGSLGFIRCFP